MIPVKEVMTTNVITFREDTPVEEVARTLTSKRITGGPVVTPDGQVVGIVSETDVFSKKGKVARDIMSQHVITVSEDTGIDEAARLLIGEKIRGKPLPESAVTIATLAGLALVLCLMLFTVSQDLLIMTGLIN